LYPHWWHDKNPKIHFNDETLANSIKQSTQQGEKKEQREIQPKVELKDPNPNCTLGLNFNCFEILRISHD